jgi:hypothetical protein
VPFQVKTKGERKMNKKGSHLVLSALLLLVLSAGVVHAQRPTSPHPQAALGSGFTYQGRLRDSSDNPINSTCDFTFSLWDAEGAGTQIGSDSIVTGTAVVDGYFAALVNSGGEFGAAAFAGAERWLQVAVRCAGDPGYTTLSPRQALSAAPYALSLRPGATISGPVAGGSGLMVTNSATTGTTYGVYGESFSPGGYAVYGSNRATIGLTSAVYGQTSSTEGYGVYGYATATSGPAYGVLGDTESTQGVGVYGHSPVSSGSVTGVKGYVHSTDGIGVAGVAIAGSGATSGVVGSAQSPDGRGVFGANSAGSGPACGVYGQSASTAGRAVQGDATAATGSTCGVFGTAASVQGRGVFGWATATNGTNWGVVGATDSPFGYGVYGSAAASNADYGLYSFGNTGATGTKSAIVQTADYAWRHLYSMESPDVLFEDVGTAQLRNGVAVVPIEPIYAQTVNLNQPYQVFLTPQGDCGLYVAEKTTASFTVRALDGKACTLSFDYRIVAKRLGFEDVRLAPAADPLLVREAMETLPAEEAQP